MPVLKLSKKKSAELVSQVNYMFSSNKVDAVDRTPVAELAFAELIAGTLPTCGDGQDVAQFYRGTLMDGVKSFMDQLVEVIQLNQEQCLLAVWAAYAYRMRVASPRGPGDIRPCVVQYLSTMPTRHGDMIKKYPNLCEQYWGIASLIYAN